MSHCLLSLFPLPFRRWIVQFTACLRLTKSQPWTAKIKGQIGSPIVMPAVYVKHWSTWSETLEGCHNLWSLLTKVSKENTQTHTRIPNYQVNALSSAHPCVKWWSHSQQSGTTTHLCTYNNWLVSLSKAKDKLHQNPSNMMTSAAHCIVGKK